MRLIDADDLITHEFKNPISFNAFKALVKRQPTLESKMEKDFKAYIASQIRQEKGPYACCYCKHRDSGAFGYCVFTGCDGIAEWEYGDPEEVEE